MPEKCIHNLICLPFSHKTQYSVTFYHGNAIYIIRVLLYTRNISLPFSRKGSETSDNKIKVRLLFCLSITQWWIGDMASPNL